MARKRFSDEDILNLLRLIEVELSSGADVQSACRKVGVSDATYYNWRKRFGGMAKSQLQEFKTLEKENIRLKRIVADVNVAEWNDRMPAARSNIAMRLPCACVPAKEVPLFSRRRMPAPHSYPLRRSS